MPHVTTHHRAGTGAFALGPLGALAHITPDLPASTREFCAVAAGAPRYRRTPHHPRAAVEHARFDNGVWRAYRQRSGWRLEVAARPGGVAAAGAVVSDDFSRGCYWTEATLPGQWPPWWSPLLQVLVGHAAPHHGALLMHGALVQVDDGAHMLLGPSGSGKTTTAQGLARWGGIVLSEDRTLLTAGMAFATPFAHTTGARPTGAPVAATSTALWFLRRSDAPGARRLAPARAASRILATALGGFWHPGWIEPALAVAAAIASTVPCFDVSLTLKEANAGAWLGQHAPEVPHAS